MKKNLLSLGLMVLALASVSCSNDDDPKLGKVDVNTVDYNESNKTNWGNYMIAVSSLLTTDASSLYSYWSETYEGGASYADIFKAHDGRQGYQSAQNCVTQIVEGCADIANEVGDAKIKDPYDKYVAGNTTEALYAVESWYSFHSRDDYSNNIISIRNSFYGNVYNGDAANINSSAYNYNTVSEHSLCAYLEKNNPILATKVKNMVRETIGAIQDIPQPFRNNIVCNESRNAMEQCAELNNLLINEVVPYFNNLPASEEAELDNIVKQYVDVVVLPTYKSLKESAEVLYKAVVEFQKSPSNAAMAKCATLWLAARAPWESSEAFLFGPVADRGLDPNMDSWPLDQTQIYQVLTSASWDKDMNWSGEYDEDSEEISAAQTVRGFHTLEYLIFKDGEARKVK